MNVFFEHIMEGILMFIMVVTATVMTLILHAMLTDGFEKECPCHIAKNHECVALEHK